MVLPVICMVMGLPVSNTQAAMLLYELTMSISVAVQGTGQ